MVQLKPQHLEDKTQKLSCSVSHLEYLNLVQKNLQNQFPVHVVHKIYQMVFINEWTSVVDRTVSKAIFHETKKKAQESKYIFYRYLQ